MDIKDLTLRDLDQLRSLLDCQPNTTGPEPYADLIGKVVVVQTVTLYYVGLLVSVHPLEIVLTDATWLADTGRWSAFLTTGEPSECEPFPAGVPVIVGRGAIVAVTAGKKLLRDVK